MSVSTCNVEGDLIDEEVYCTTDPLTNTFKIQQFTTGTIPIDTDIFFTIDSVQNAGIYTTLGGIALTIYSERDAPVCLGDYTIVGNDFINNNITEFDAECLDPTAGSDVVYEFTVVPASRVARFSYLMIYLPDELSVVDEGEMQSACPDYPAYGFSEDYILCEYESDSDGFENGFNRSIMIKNGFETASPEADPPVL